MVVYSICKFVFQGYEWADTQNEAHVHLSNAKSGTYYIGLYSPNDFSSFTLSATIIDCNKISVFVSN